MHGHTGNGIFISDNTKWIHVYIVVKSLHNDQEQSCKTFSLCNPMLTILLQYVHYSFIFIPFQESQNTINCNAYLIHCICDLICKNPTYVIAHFWKFILLHNYVQGIKSFQYQVSIAKQFPVKSFESYKCNTWLCMHSYGD